MTIGPHDVFSVSVYFLPVSMVIFGSLEPNVCTLGSLGRVPPQATGNDLNGSGVGEPLRVGVELASGLCFLSPPLTAAAMPMIPPTAATTPTMVRIATRRRLRRRLFS